MRSNKINTIIKILALVLAALTLMGGCSGSGCKGCKKGEDAAMVDTRGESEAPQGTEEATSSSEPTATPEPTAEPGGEVTAAGKPMAFVRANSTGTYGVASDGSVRFRGRSVTGQHLIYDWANISDLELNDSTTAALTGLGTLILTGTKKGYEAALDWTNITDIAMGDQHLVGLKSDGTVVACGADHKGQCKVSDWTGVIKIVAGGDFTAALTDGVVVTTIGSGFDEALNADPVVDIEAAGDRIVLLLKNGTVRTVKLKYRSGAKSAEGGEGADVGEFTDMDWEGAVRIFAAKGSTFAIDGEGRVFADSSVLSSEEAGSITGAYTLSASEKHVVVLFGDGTCKGYGDNGDLQTAVTGWRLLPYVTDEGWLLGLVPGGEYDGAPAVTGREVNYADPVTGEERAATCVILGDVNGDGKIDESDTAAVEAHVKGSRKLTGAFLRAANVIMDSSKPNSIDINDVERITAQAGGRNVIDQYAKTDAYTAPLADAKRKNSDALGYITIKGTNISYPIMYDKQWFYNDHDIDRNKATRGCIYFYWGKANKNIVITGHNSRQSGTMFHQLHKVQDSASKLKTYANRVWAINTYGQTGYWEVWALYEEPGFSNPNKSSQMYNTCWPNTFNALNEQDKQKWINYQQKKNKLGYTVNVTTEDRFMTLVTCGDTHAEAQRGSRLYIFLHWVGND